MLLSIELSQLINVCNKYFILTVLCPWGCSEFLHLARSVNLNIIIQRYLSKCYLLDNNNVLAKIESAHDNYIRDNMNDYNK